MPPRFCCCDCVLGSDNFNRADSDPPTGDWKLVSGTAEILSNEVVVDGVLATTICHSSAYEYGSFEAFFDIVDPSDGDIIEFAGGDPGAPKVIVKIEFTGSAGSGTIDVTIDTDDEDITPLSYGTPIVWPGDDTTIRVQFCYAPGLEATVSLSGASGTYTPKFTCCLGDDSSDYCFTAGGDPVGNFSFRFGTFDNWEYYVHWQDRKDCDFCSCFCRIFDESIGFLEYSCLPQEVTINLSPDSICSGLPSTVKAYQSIRTDAPSDADPNVEKWPEKVYWVTDPISCPEGAGFKFTLELACVGTGKDDIGEVPQFQMTCIVRNSPNAIGSNFGFDPDDPDTIDTANPGPGDDNISIAVCSSGTCDPLNLQFPDLRESSYNSAYGNSCCGGYVDSGGSYEPDVRIGVSVTV